MAEKKEFRTRISYKTDNATWSKVCMVDIHDNINERDKALDKIIDLGYEVWDNERKKNKK